MGVRSCTEAGLRRILIVEDNEMNRDVLSRHLKRRGFDVVVAVDGVHGLDDGRVAQAGSDPHGSRSCRRLDGWECTQRLKANAATREIPVIALSAHAMVGDRERALEVGCDDFDTKPIDLAGLLLKMERLFASHRETRSA